MPSELTLSLGQYDARVRATIAEAEGRDVVPRIWKSDVSVWTNNEAQQQIISNSLGWLTVAQRMEAAVDGLHEFARTIAKDFAQVMVCGMGGSSLCPEVLAKTFGKQPGFPQLLVLDSTDPDYIFSLREQVDITRCLFVIASKSGTTTEPLCFYRYWYDQVAQHSANPGDSFVLITDPGTALLAEAREKKFRRVFLNQPDIGGRYSALSYFGMLPAALMGLDVGRLLQSAKAMAQSCGPETSLGENPGVLLGATIGECARVGRDKLTLVIASRLATLGLWIEQLVAESTGKEGKGILPVSGETMAGPAVYGADRLFVSIATGNEEESRLQELEQAGHPIVRQTISDLYDLGGEFFLWEFATAVAGWRLGINPFDQPNVQEAKDATRNLLEQFSKNGALPEQSALVSDDLLTVYAAERSRASLPSGSVVDVIRAHVGGAGAGDYFALLSYIEETPEIEMALQSIRTLLRDKKHCATSTGYGPRFLHSTGQLHKGGPDSGNFIQITAADEIDLPIPGENYSFSVLKQAQALGDFEALSSRGRRAIRVDLGKSTLRGLARLEEIVG